MAYDFQKNQDARHSRRLKAEDRYLGRLERKEAEAAKMVGQLNRDGKTVYYIYPTSTNVYRESTQEYDLIQFLIRNKYV